MNTPQGFTLDSEGNPTAVNVGQVLFNPMLGPQYWHFIAAAYMTAGFLVASVYAVGWLRGRRDRYHRLGFLVPFTVAAIVTPIQLGIGDFIARSVYQKQPAKFAAIEIVWETGPNQTGVPLRTAATGRDGGRRSRSPGSTRSWPASAGTPSCRASASFPEDERATIREANIAHWAFDTMVGIGTVLFLLSAVVRAGVAAAAGHATVPVVLPMRGRGRRRLRRRRRVPGGSPPRSAGSRGSSGST